MTAERRLEVRRAVAAEPGARLKQVVAAIGWPSSSFFHVRKASKKRPGPPRRPLDPILVEKVRQVALAYPWWGYKRLAVVCRRQGLSVSNRFVYRVLRQGGLLQKKRRRSAELYQAARLFELLPEGPNQLWQADVTYIHIPGFGWWYAVTVIDYFSRYLLALHLSPSNDAGALITGIDQAMAEAERLHGPLRRTPTLVTDNGSNFLARRFQRHIKGWLNQVRTQYRTPQQLGLLERFHQTLKREEAYWDIYRSVGEARDRLAVFRQRYNEVRPHWALLPLAGGDPVTPADVYCRATPVQLPQWQGWARAAKAKIEAMLNGDDERQAA